MQIGKGIAYETVRNGGVQAQERIKRKHIMGGSALEIGLASTVLTLPMLTLTAVLIALVCINRMPSHSSTYSYNNETALALGSAFYVKYSPTALVYIASLSSTLATILISSAMVLFSYPLARNMIRKSDSRDTSRLPSPFQLQLLIRMIDGRLTALWSYLFYISSRKQRKTPIVPLLWRAVAMMVTLVLLA